MEVIAADAGRSRASIYRQFPNRKSLLEALVLRVIQRQGQTLSERLPPDATIADIITESLVIAATELVHDPTIQTISEQSDEGGVAYLIGNNPNLTQTVETLIEPMVSNADRVFRKGLHPRDIGQFLIVTGINLLLQLVPGAQDPTIARSYVETFVLPAIIDNPPKPRGVFARSTAND